MASASLYVGDLLSDVTEGMLFEVFSVIGQVTLIRVCRDAMTKRSLGYAYVNYLNREDAETALRTLNTTPIKGRPCRIMWSQRDPSLRKSGLGNLFVKNLDKSVTGKDLYQTFSQIGNVLSCKVALDSTNTSKGFGFVQYETQEMAIRAIETLNDTPTLSQKLIVQRYIPRLERIKDDRFTNLFLKNLDENVLEEQLEESFAKFGKIQNLALMKDNDGRSKCFAFVNYYEHEAAVKAIEAMNGKVLKEGGKVIYVGKALKKDERSRMLQQTRRNPMGHPSTAPAVSHSQSLNLYVKNLEDEVTNERLAQEFSRYGELISARVMRNEPTGTSRGFGFVWFKNNEDGMKALEEMNGKVLVNQPLFVDLAKKRDGRRSNYYYNGNHSNYSNYSSSSKNVSQQQGHPKSRGRGGNRNHNTRQRGRSSHFDNSNSNSNTKKSRPQGNEKHYQQNQHHQQQYQHQNQQTQQQEQPQPEQQVEVASQDVLQNLGDELFAYISQKDEDLAPKITGMLLEGKTDEDIKALLANTEDLDKQIAEAKAAYESYLKSAAAPAEQ